MEEPSQIEKIGKSIERYLGLPALVIGFTVDIVALVTIFSAPVSSQSAFTLNPVTQLTIWASATMAYIGILKRIWKGEVQKVGSEASGDFTSFLTSDLLSLKFPFLLIPWVALGGFFINILSHNPLPTIGVISAILAVWGIGTFVRWAIAENAREKEAAKAREERYRQETERQDAESKRRENAEWDGVRGQFERWSTRIDKEIALHGYTTDKDLSAKYLERVSLCRKAMLLYSQTYDAAKDIAPVTTWQVSRITPGYSLLRDYDEIQVLASRSQGLAKPWLKDQHRYFNLSVID